MLTVIKKMQLEHKVFGKIFKSIAPLAKNLNHTRAEKLGLQELHLHGYPTADQLITDVLAKKFDMNKVDDQKKFVKAWEEKLEDIPPLYVTKYRDYWFLKKLQERKIIQNLEGKAVPYKMLFSETNILVESWPETDWGKLSAKSLLLKELLGTSMVVNICREQLDEALWSGDPANHKKNKKHVELVESLSLNPDEWEFRCIRWEEYSRGAKQMNWGQSELWTHFDGYFLWDDDRNGLAGGGRADGGAADVGHYWRDTAGSHLAVRLVLSRTG